MIQGRKNKKNFKSDKPQSEFEQRIIDLARVTRVMAGGKRLRFRACVALGDHNGRVGWSVAKGADVAIAVNKAVTKAKKNILKIKLVGNTIPHQVEGKFKSAKVLLKPAVEGTGIIAGGAVRQVMELAGVPNIYGKILGSTSNKINNIQATFSALHNLQYADEQLSDVLDTESAKERDLDQEEELEKEQAKILKRDGVDSENFKKGKLVVKAKK